VRYVDRRLMTGRTDSDPAVRRQGARTGRTRTRLRVVLAALFAALALAAVPTAAQADPGGDDVERTVQGNLVNTAEGGAPVEGAVVTVTTADGQEFTGEADAEGNFEITFSAPPGPLTVALDTDTLPDGVEMREGAKSEQKISSTLSVVNVDFQIGPDNRQIETKWDRVPRYIYNGLLFGLILALASLGLSMVFGTTGLTNFAHGELVTFGAMCTFFLNTAIGVPFILTVPMTVILAMAFGWLQDKGLWGPLRHRGIGLIAMMIVSIGLQFLLRNVFAYLTGSRLQNYDEYLTSTGRDFAGLFTYTYRDIAIAAVCIVVLLTVILGLSYTRMGRATRAVSDNPALAAATGINVDRVISLVWIVGTGLAALAGVFLGFQLGVTYQIGQLVLLLLFAAVCVGGLGSVWGALVGSLIIGVLIELSTLVIPADLKNAGALFLLVLILLVRPQGLLGRRERVG
jgi:neutral amino acid transport system permease protein